MIFTSEIIIQGFVMSNYFVGIDNGGTKTKCCIFDESGKLISSSSVSIPVSTPHPGWVERNCEDVWYGNIKVIKSSIEKASEHSTFHVNDIKAVGLTGYGNGVCFVDENGESLYPAVVSTDSRASTYLDKWENDGTMLAVYEKTFQKIWDAQPAALIPWFRDNMPEILKKAKYSLDIKDYVRFCLTGVLCSEITAASSGALMNIFEKKYDYDIFQLLGIEDYWGITPPYVGSTDISGYITKKASQATGLPEGIPVSGGYFDIDAGSLGAGVTSQGILNLIAGTWSINEYITNDINSSKGKFSNTVGYLPGYYVVEDSSPTSCANLEWFLHNFLLMNKNKKEPQIEGDIYKRCDEIIEKIDPNKNRIVFVPYVFASSSNPLSRGAFLNLTANCDWKYMLEAVYEGIVFSSAFHVKRLIKGMPNFRCARLSGGITKSDYWTQMLCDTINIPIETLEGDEQSALGAAISGAIACGHYLNEQDAVNSMTHVKKTFYPKPLRVKIMQDKFKTFEKAIRSVDYFHSGKIDYSGFMNEVQKTIEK